jgi:hypothetical protein
MTRFVRFANNATSKLAANLSNVSTTMSVTPGDGSKFPALSAGQFFKLSLIRGDGTKEIIKVTARASDTMTIVRADEAVGGVQVAYSFTAGDKVELRLTADALGNEFDRLDAAAFLDVVGIAANYTVTEADISKLLKTSTGSGPVTITLPQISTLTASFEIQVSKDTGDTNAVTVAASGGNTINGLSTYILSAQYQSIWLVADLATSTWTAIVTASASNKIVNQFTGSGTPGPFTLSGVPGSKNNTEVYVGGVYQNKNTYTLTGNSLMLGGNVPPGVIGECTFVQPLSIGAPSDGTVSEIKLADDTRSAIRSQQYSAGTTAGTGSAYTLVVTPALTSYAPGQSFWVKFHAASSANPTLQISGLATPPALVCYDSSGNLVNIASGQIPANFFSRCTLVATNQVLVEELPPLVIPVVPVLRAPIQPIGATVAANALTLTLNPTSLDFRSDTLGSGAIATRTVASFINMVVPSTATLGTVSGVLSRLAVLAITFAGNVELAVVNIAGGNNLDEAGVISTTAIAGASNSASTIYSTTARTNVPYRVVGYVESTQATAGTWATAPSLIQGHGGQAAAAMAAIGYGQTWQDVTGSRANGTTYYNTTSKPITCVLTPTSAGSNSTVTVGGTVLVNAIPINSPITFVVPPMSSYSATLGGGVGRWAELR